ncbi:unnamed protein product, partial [Didymodactylos carnosus]
SIINFYFSSAALSSSIANSLYIYYLIQILRSKTLTESNCRAIYYLQTSCSVVLAYTIIAMQLNFLICLLSSSSNQNNQKTTTTTTLSSSYLKSGSPTDSSYNDKSSRTTMHSLFMCSMKFLRRFCFCFVICVWGISFTATIPLLYSIDSNEKNPKPVYCPGTKLTVAEEWFDESRLIQSILFYLVPFIISLLLTMIALLKLFSDYLIYIFQNCFYHFSSRHTSRKKSISMKISKKSNDGYNCFCCCHQIRTFSYYDTPPSIRYSSSIISNLGIIANNNASIPISDQQWVPSSPSSSTSSLSTPSCSSWCSSSFLKFLLVLSCNVLATIYPIALRFYLVYFSILIPLIFAILNYSLNNLVVNTNDITSITTTPTNIAIVQPSTMISCYKKTNIPVQTEKQLRKKSNINENTVTSNLLPMKNISSTNENDSVGGEDEDENDDNESITYERQHFLFPSSLHSSYSGTTNTAAKDITSIRQNQQKQYRRNFR